jgi:hypothetical protein
VLSQRLASATAGHAAGSTDGRHRHLASHPSCSPPLSTPGSLSRSSRGGARNRQARRRARHAARCQGGGSPWSSTTTTHATCSALSRHNRIAHSPDRAGPRASAAATRAATRRGARGSAGLRSRTRVIPMLCGSVGSPEQDVTPMPPGGRRPRLIWLGVMPHTSPPAPPRAACRSCHRARRPGRRRWVVPGRGAQNHAKDGMSRAVLPAWLGVGCINSLSGCRGFVFVDEAAEQVSSSRRHR